jgi:hypothetical protein
MSGFEAWECTQDERQECVRQSDTNIPTEPCIAALHLPLDVLHAVFDDERGGAGAFPRRREHVPVSSSMEEPSPKALLEGAEPAEGG